MARAMGVDTRGMTVIQASDKWSDEVERLLADLNIQTGHLSQQFGVQKKELEDLVTTTATRYSKGRMSESNPREFNFEEGIRLLKSML